MGLSIRFHPGLFIVWATLYGCQSSVGPSMESDYGYFPLETGRFIIYDVQERVYSLNALPIQHQYQIKETTGSAYTDVAGQLAYKLLRYTRLNADQPWQADSIWSARLVNNQAIRVENGQDFVRLLFPLTNGLKWTETRNTASDQNEVEARNVGQRFSVLGKEFGETVTVVAEDDSTLILQNKRQEVYARQVGLIYKERTVLHFCTDTPACIGKNQIDYGIQQVYHIQTYGKE